MWVASNPHLIIICRLGTCDQSSRLIYTWPLFGVHCTHSGPIIKSLYSKLQECSLLVQNRIQFPLKTKLSKISDCFLIAFKRLPGMYQLSAYFTHLSIPFLTADITANKGAPAYPEHERYKLIRAIKWVDEVSTLTKWYFFLFSMDFPWMTTWYWPETRKGVCSVCPSPQTSPKNVLLMHIMAYEWQQVDHRRLEGTVEFVIQLHPMLFSLIKMSRVRRPFSSREEPQASNQVSQSYM
jgi:hypothetical protein